MGPRHRLIFCKGVSHVGCIVFTHHKYLAILHMNSYFHPRIFILFSKTLSVCNAQPSKVHIFYRKKFCSYKRMNGSQYLISFCATTTDVDHFIRIAESGHPQHSNFPSTMLKLSVFNIRDGQSLDHHYSSLSSSRKVIFIAKYGSAIMDIIFLS